MQKNPKTNLSKTEAAGKPDQKSVEKPKAAPKTPTAAKGAKKPAEASKEANPKPAATGAKQRAAVAKKSGGKKAAGKMSGLDAAAKVLAIREIAAKKKESRFRKTSRGKFAVNG